MALVINGKKLTEAEAAEYISKLEAKNAELEKATAAKVSGLSCKVSAKGALSVYGITGRWPMTYYISTWDALLSDENLAKVRAFITENRAKFSTKEKD